ncbi:hypothetical protein CIG75_03150 [Tumebacillus algifaecis]|uniref:DUF2634 domain-containing protein n=1 Tax=Tumebacillus algifaecis TaxID=1214604 RepID=A0A223CXJ0_9BACL|nr:DUF2634 domain-containing protein [Tumebacillus algifaecis]ASS74079.1 hypothetical protein CIG75_03150 [Tumebacillus algifaecis]
MSILPQFAMIEEPTLMASNLQTTVRSGKNPVFDYQKGEYVRTATGRIAEVEGLESLKGWVLKALITARNRFLVYTSEYGNEAHELIGVDLPDEILFMELQRQITEALIYDPRITSCTDFRFEREAERVSCEFALITPLGTETMHYTLEVS